MVASLVELWIRAKEVSCSLDRVESMDWETARSETSGKDQVQTTLSVPYPSPITILQDQRRDQAPSGSMVRRIENTRTKEDRHDHHLGYVT